MASIRKPNKKVELSVSVGVHVMVVIVNVEALLLRRKLANMDKNRRLLNARIRTPSLQI